MGWKNLKTAYAIDHNVQITEKGLCIGSGYVHDLAVIDLSTGSIKENPTFSNFLRDNYPKLLEADPKELLKLLESPDEFKGSIPVFTYDGGVIIEEKAEVFGYPHATYEGNLMYDNTYFRTRKEAVEASKKNLNAGISLMTSAIKDTEKKLEDYKLELQKYQQQKILLEKEEE